MIKVYWDSNFCLSLKQGPQKAAATRAKNELQHVRVALSDLKQEHMQLKTIFGKEVQCCERQIAVSCASGLQINEMHISLNTF